LHQYRVEKAHVFFQQGEFPMLQNFSIREACLACLLTMACGSSAMPQAKLVNAKSTISAAEEAGAANNPQAALHLKLARDQLSTAERLNRNGDGDEATLYANQAQVDAEMARALAHEQRERAATQETEGKLHELVQESN
jgi:hypothetical protein